MRPPLLALCLLLLAGACQQQPEEPRFQGDPPGLSNGKLAAAHILIQWEGVDRQQLSVVRTRKEARALAEELVKRLRAGEDFAQLAREYSDDPTTARKGGELGAFRPQKMISAFSNAALKLHYGEISEPVQTRQGFQIILRRPVEECRVRHLLLMHVESAQRPDAITRSVDEARRLAEEALGRARAGEDFLALVREYSDAPDTTQGGEIGPFSRGEMVDSFEQAAFALEPGALSGIVESIYGFHVILRLD